LENLCGQFAGLLGMKRIRINPFPATGAVEEESAIQSFEN
jgi:hypothetical protein